MKIFFLIFATCLSQISWAEFSLTVKNSSSNSYVELEAEDLWVYELSQPRFRIRAGRPLDLNTFNAYAHSIEKVYVPAKYNQINVKTIHNPLAEVFTIYLTMTGKRTYSEQNQIHSVEKQFLVGSFEIACEGIPKEIYIKYKGFSESGEPDFAVFVDNNINEHTIHYLLDGLKIDDSEENSDESEPQYAFKFPIKQEFKKSALNRKGLNRIAKISSSSRI